MIISPFKRRRVQKIVRDAFWQGFLHGLGMRSTAGLDFASNSGLYQYNDIRRIAEDAGYHLALTALDAHQQPQRRWVRGAPYEIPARVWADCYAAADL